MKKIGSGLIKVAYLNDDETKIIKRIKQNPKNAFGGKVSRKLINENMMRAIRYNNEYEKVFAETKKIKAGEYEQEICKFVKLSCSDVKQDVKERFAEKLVNLLRRNYGLVDSIQPALDKNGELVIADLDSFADFSDCEALGSRFAYTVKCALRDLIGTKMDGMKCTPNEVIDLYENWKKAEKN